MTEEKEPCTFKCEGSMWQLLYQGKKTWDARFYDIADDRIYRLAWGKWDEMEGRQPSFLPQETYVRFVNKEGGHVLEFRYAGMMFCEWAPGWCFLQLGGLVRVYNSDGRVIEDIEREKIKDWLRERRKQ